MSSDDDEQPAPKSRIFHPPNLEPLSLDELAAYIAVLRDEITRVEEEINRKKKHRDSVENLFRRG